METHQQERRCVFRDDLPRLTRVRGRRRAAPAGSKACTAVPTFQIDPILNDNLFNVECPNVRESQLLRLVLKFADQRLGDSAAAPEFSLLVFGSCNALKLHDRMRLFTV